MVAFHRVSQMVDRSKFFDALGVPGLALLVFLFIGPLFAVAAFSLGTTDILGRPVLGLSWGSYRGALQPYVLPTLGRTVLFAFLTTVICLLVGYPVAYLAARFAGRWGQLIIGALVLTWLVDYLVRIFAWTTLLDREGLINDVIAALGFSRIQLLSTNAATIIGLVYGYLPLMILPVYAALENFDTAQIDAGKDLYGTPVRTFLHVTLPGTGQGIIGGILLVFLPAMGDFATAQFLGGPQSTMIANLINTQFANGGSITFGSALTVALLTLLAASLALILAITRRVLGSRASEVLG